MHQAMPMIIAQIVTAVDTCTWKVSIFEAIWIYANSFYVSMRVCPSAHFSIAHYDVPPIGINLHQGWGVRSVIKIRVVFWLWTGESLCLIIQWALRIHRVTFVVISRCNMQVKITENLRSGEVSFRIIAILEVCGQQRRAVDCMHDDYR